MSSGSGKQRRPAAFPVVAAALAALAALSAAGCSKGLDGGGPDIGFIEPEKSVKKDAKKAPPRIKDPNAAPLRLSAGRKWGFLAIRGKDTFPTEIEVKGTFTVPKTGAQGLLVESRRKGKVFRTEVLREDAQGGLEVLALGETSKEMMVFSPPVPLYKRPYTEGAAQVWHGTARMRGRDFAAKAFSRISAVEKADTLAGDYAAYRLDHILSLTTGATSKIDYPAVYWLVPDVGIVRRRLADRGQVMVEDLRKAPPTPTTR